MSSGKEEPEAGMYIPKYFVNFINTGKRMYARIVWHTIHKDISFISICASSKTFNVYNVYEEKWDIF
jgi:hypothetical protein